MSTKITRYEGEIDLPEEVRAYVREAVSENTRRAYRSDLDHFAAWGGGIPASPETVAAYLSAHAQVLAVAALENRVAGSAKIGQPLRL